MCSEVFICSFNEFTKIRFLSYFQTSVVLHLPTPGEFQGVTSRTSVYNTHWNTENVLPNARIKCNCPDVVILVQDINADKLEPKFYVNQEID